jgi:hypothetical protein
MVAVRDRAGRAEPVHPEEDQAVARRSTLPRSNEAVSDGFCAGSGRPAPAASDAGVSGLEPAA